MADSTAVPLNDTDLQRLAKQPNTRVFRHEHVDVRDPTPVAELRAAITAAHRALRELFARTPQASAADDERAAAAVMASLPRDVQEICRAHPSFTTKLMKRETALNAECIATLHYIIGLRELVEQGRATEEETQQMFVERMLASAQ